jgi:hypothetical protein
MTQEGNENTGISVQVGNDNELFHERGLATAFWPPMVSRVVANVPCRPPACRGA